LNKYLFSSINILISDNIPVSELLIDFFNVSTYFINTTHFNILSFFGESLSKDTSAFSFVQSYLVYFTSRLSDSVGFSFNFNKIILHLCPSEVGGVGNIVFI
jgi:hypothetical protein